MMTFETKNTDLKMCACIYIEPPTMSRNDIIHHTAFDASMVTFTDLRKNKMGGKVVYLTDSHQNKLQVQLPKMRAPFGISEFTDSNSGRSSYSLDLSLDGQDDLMKKLRAVDDAIVNVIAKNSAAWLGKKHSANVIRDALYKPIVKDPADPKYSPTIKLKLLKGRDDSFTAETYNMQQQKVALSDLEKGQMVNTIIELNQIWIIDNKCGVSIRLAQALIHPTNKLTGFAFKLDDDEITGGATEEEEYGDDDEIEDDM